MLSDLSKKTREKLSPGESKVTIDLSKISYIETGTLQPPPPLPQTTQPTTITNSPTNNNGTNTSKNTHGDGDSRGLVIGLSVGIVVLVLVLLTVMVCFICRKRYSMFKCM